MSVRLKGECVLNLVEMGSRIKYAREMRGFTMAELAEKVGVNKSTIKRYEDALIANPKLPALHAIANALGINPAWLFCKSDDILPVAETPELPLALHEIVAELNDGGVSELLDYGRYLYSKDEFRLADGESRNFYPLPTAKVPKGEIRYIRHYLTPAAAGYASPIEGEDYELIPVTEDVPARADFCISISGDSMAPYIEDGSTVYVQRDASLEEFDVGVFFVDGDVLCKQYCTDNFGTLYLLSANPPREDANRIIPRSSDSTLVCFGKVILPRKLPKPIY